MYLENIAKRTDRKKKAKRLGRGYGSGVGGHTVGRGTKGQKSRSGHKSLVAFEGGNLPFYKRIPKYPGFKSRSKVKTQVINLKTLEENFKSGEKINKETLENKGLIKKGSNQIKILAEGDIKKKFVIEGVKISSIAQEKVEKAGGTVK
jgi:large subunit ribosomal protein L15